MGGVEDEAGVRRGVCVSVCVCADTDCIVFHYAYSCGDM